MRPPSSLEQASRVASPVCCSLPVTVQGCDMAAVAAGQMSNSEQHLLPTGFGVGARSPAEHLGEVPRTVVPERVPIFERIGVP